MSFSQEEVSEEAIGLHCAPFEPSEWVMKYHGRHDDTDEERSELGRGASAITLRMQNSEGLVVAVKKFHRTRNTQSLEDKVLQEARTLHLLQHRHVVRYLGVLKTRRSLLLIMELAPGGSLADLIPSRIQVEKIEQFAGQLAAALDYIHWRGFVHRDVKSANVLLSAEGRAMLADFGLACVVATAMSNLCTRSGTLSYMSPERGRGHEYGRKADMWALGCILLELFIAELLKGPIWDDGAVVTARRNALVQTACDRCAARPPRIASGQQPICCVLLAMILWRRPGARSWRIR